MLVNTTQKTAHADAIQKLHHKAQQYLDVVDDAYATEVDVHIQRDALNDAIAELQHLNDLMDHTKDEDEHLKAAFEQWINPTKDSELVVQDILELTSEEAE